MRGKAGKHRGHVPASRITPAYAGKSSRSPPRMTRTQDHPRVCGEKLDYSVYRTPDTGSPPRMRGKVEQLVTAGFTTGITPAYAGKRPISSIRWCGSWDHPRVCGEKDRYHPSDGAVRGSPPRMRGKVVNIEIFRESIRITPAYAGKSQSYKKTSSC